MIKLESDNFCAERGANCANSRSYLINSQRSTVQKESILNYRLILFGYLTWCMFDLAIAFRHLWHL